jgi:ATP-dependent RNA helicase DDX21
MMDHIDRGTMQLSDVEFLCLDEADQMLDIGFADAMDKVMTQVKEQIQVSITSGKRQDKAYQTLLFSATLPEWVNQTVKKFMKPDYVKVDLIGQQKLKTSEMVQHYAIPSHWKVRNEILPDVVSIYAGVTGRSIVFTNTKSDCNELAALPRLREFAQPLHGDIPQAQREKTLAKFRAGYIRCLICTDVAARGLDIPEVDLVVNSEPTDSYETYIHRSGRTGRAGRKGICVTFIKPDQFSWTRQLEQRAGLKMHTVCAPTPSSIVQVAGEHAAERVQAVPAHMAAKFHSIADQILIASDGKQALAAALAVLSGYREDDTTTTFQHRSLLTAETGYISALVHSDNAMRTASYVWSMFDRMGVPRDAARSVKLCEDGTQAFVDFFDAQVEFDAQGKLVKAGGARVKMEHGVEITLCTELPKLQLQDDGRNAFGNRGGSGGRFFGRSGGGGGGGASRFGGGSGRFGGGNSRFAPRQGTGRFSSR